MKILTLKNGLRVLHFFDPHRNTIQIHIGINAGSRNEKSPQSGLSHLTEHIVFANTLEQYRKRIDHKAYIAESFDGTTFKDRTIFNFHVHKKDIAEIKPFIVAIFTIAPDKQATLRETKLITQELLEESSNPEFQFERELQKQLYGSSSYTHEILGTKQSLNKITTNDVIAFHKHFYTTRNSVIALHGPIRQNEIEKYIGNINIRSGEEISQPTFIPAKAATLQKKSKGVYGFVAVSRNFDIQSPEVGVKLWILTEMLSPYIYNALRHKEHVYASSTDFIAYEDKGIVVTEATCAKTNAAKVVERIRAAEKDFQKNFNARFFKRRLIPL